MVCAVEIDRIIGAQYMILSSISKVGNIYSLDSRLISAATFAARLKQLVINV